MADSRSGQIKYKMSLEHLCQKAKNYAKTDEDISKGHKSWPEHLILAKFGKFEHQKLK